MFMKIFATGLIALGLLTISPIKQPVQAQQTNFFGYFNSGNNSVRPRRESRRVRNWRKKARYHERKARQYRRKVENYRRRPVRRKKTPFGFNFEFGFLGG